MINITVPSPIPNALLRNSASRLSFRRVTTALLLLVAAACVFRPAAAGSLEYNHHVLDLSGHLLSARITDANGDGLQDLVLVTGESVGKQRFETVARGAAIFAELVAFQVREKRLMVLLQKTDGRFEGDGSHAVLPEEVIAFDLTDLDGDGWQELLLLDDSGLSVCPRKDSGSLSWSMKPEPLVETYTTFTGSCQFFGGYSFLDDIDGDGSADIVLPRYQETLVYFAPFPAAARRGPVKEPDLVINTGEPDLSRSSGRLRTSFHRPEITDINGDGLNDLMLEVENGVEIYRQNSPRVFPDEPKQISYPEPGESYEGQGGYFGDVTGDGPADLVIFYTKEGENERLRDAKSPRTYVEVYPGNEQLEFSEGPVSRSLVRGMVLSDDDDFLFPSFLDLNGDDLPDLLSISFDFSMFQIVRLATTQKLTIDLLIKSFLQTPGHGFHGIPVHEVEEKIRINLRNLEMPELPFFSGDFNGDGIRDFVRLLGGKEIAVYVSLGDGTYTTRPDLKLKLAPPVREPDLLLVRELNADERSDVLLFKGRQGQNDGFRMDLYTSTP